MPAFVESMKIGVCVFPGVLITAGEEACPGMFRLGRVIYHWFREREVGHDTEQDQLSQISQLPALPTPRPQCTAWLKAETSGEECRGPQAGPGREGEVVQIL